MSKKGFNIRVEESTIDHLSEIGTYAGMDKNAYAAMVLNTFARLRPEHALDAIPSIPKQYFRRGPGRPTTATEPASEFLDR